MGRLENRSSLDYVEKKNQIKEWSTQVLNAAPGIMNDVFGILSDDLAKKSSFLQNQRKAALQLQTKALEALRDAKDVNRKFQTDALNVLKTLEDMINKELLSIIASKRQANPI